MGETAISGTKPEQAWVLLPSSKIRFSQCILFDLSCTEGKVFVVVFWVFVVVVLFVFATQHNKGTVPSAEAMVRKVCLQA